MDFREYIYLDMGVRDSKGKAGEHLDDINGFDQKARCW
jgi:hypothetical protein